MSFGCVGLLGCFVAGFLLGYFFLFFKFLESGLTGFWLVGPIFSGG